MSDFFKNRVITAFHRLGPLNIEKLEDRHGESQCVIAFAEGINRAGKIFWQDPSSMQLIPNWHRVTAALPDFFSGLQEAVSKDNK